MVLRSYTFSVYCKLKSVLEKGRTIQSQIKGSKSTYGVETQGGLHKLVAINGALPLVKVLQLLHDWQENV